MSPLWRDRVQVLVEPGRLRVRRLARGWRPRPGIPVTHACSRDDAGTAGWSAPVACLAGLAADPSWRGCDVDVLLSGHFVRYTIVPADEQLVSAAEREACARHLLRQTYGDAADAWCVRLADAAPGRPSVAAAVDAGLLDAVTAACRAGGARLRRLDPYLALIANRLRRELGGPDVWLAVVECGRLCLARLRRGTWLALQQQRLNGRLEDDLPAALARHACAAGEATNGGRVYVFAPGRESMVWPRDAGWSWQQVPVRDPEFPEWP